MDVYRGAKSEKRSWRRSDVLCQKAASRCGKQKMFQIRILSSKRRIHDELHHQVVSRDSGGDICTAANKLMGPPLLPVPDDGTSHGRCFYHGHHISHDRQDFLIRFLAQSVHSIAIATGTLRRRRSETTTTEDAIIVGVVSIMPNGGVSGSSNTLWTKLRWEDEDVSTCRSLTVALLCGQRGRLVGKSAGVAG